MISVLAAISAAQLLGFCTESSEAAAAMCNGFILGVADAHLNANPPTLCVADRSAGYLPLITKFVAKAKADAPAVLEIQPASTYLADQWRTDYPCPSSP